MLTNSILVFSILILIILLLAVFLKNPRKSQNIFLSLFIFSGALWVLTNLVINITTTSTSAIFWSNISILPAAGIPYFFLFFTEVFPFTKKFSFIKIFIFSIPLIPFFIFMVSPQNIKYAEPGGDNIQTGNLYFYLILFYIFYLGLSVINLIRSRKKVPRIQKSQIDYIFVGIAASSIVGIITNGFTLLFNISTPAKIGSASVLIFALFSSIAIIRHKLFDIRAVVARSVAFVLSITTVGFIYGFIAFRLITPLIQNFNQNTQYVIFTILAVVIAFTFQPLRRVFEKVTDKIFYRDKYDPQALINAIGQILASEIRLDVLDKKVTDELVSQMRIAKAQIVVLDKEMIYYQSQGQLRPGLGGGEILKQEILNRVQDDNKGVQDDNKGVQDDNKGVQDDRSGRTEGYRIEDLRHLGKSLIIADDLPLESERKKILEKYRAGASLVLKTKEGLVGFLLIGEKKSGDIFNSQDIRVLQIIANELAVAIQNSKAYEEIRRFNLTLRQKIAEATRNLKIANLHLKELDRAKDEFISMASHQLRTPLTTVKGYLSMLSEGDFGKLTLEQKDSIKLAFDGADRMAGLISDLLNISRMEAGRFFLEKKPLDLNKVVEDEVKHLQFRADSAGVKLSLIKGQPVPEVVVDEDKIRQVIMNLVDNAIHYAPKGKVWVEFGLVNSSAVLKVNDNGIGVPSRDKKKMFSKFFRADNAQKTRPDGTGLGLYLVKRVVEDHGGEVIFKSEEGKGSTFGFKLPIKAVDK